MLRLLLKHRHPSLPEAPHLFSSTFGGGLLSTILLLALFLGAAAPLASGCASEGGAREIDCTDGEDNDDDGLTDCMDDDCADDPACGSSVENCTNGVDDDSDGLTDCMDSDCDDDPACSSPTENCTNGLDDDSDGLTDCDDDDCAGEPACDPNAEDCQNGVDDDGDGLTDCDDDDCAGDPACDPTSEDCQNDVDDDGDGLTDCDDDDCTGDPACSFGDLSCKGVRYCYACCSSGDLSCFDACYAEGSSDAKSGITAIQNCTDGNCSTECSGGTPEQCDTCVSANCALQLSQCNWEPAGSGVCVDLYNCIATCPSPTQDHSGDASTCPSNDGLLCYQTCYDAADADAVTKMRAWLFCMEDFCYDECYGPNADGVDCQNCYNSACSAEVTACQND